MKYKMYEYIKVDSVGLKEDDDIILINDNTESVIIVNNTAWVIVDLITKEKDREEIIEYLSSTYDASKEEIVNGVDKIINDLIGEGIILEVK